MSSSRSHNMSSRSLIPLKLQSAVRLTNVTWPPLRAARGCKERRGSLRRAPRPAPPPVLEAGAASALPFEPHARALGHPGRYRHFELTPLLNNAGAAAFRTWLGGADYAGVAALLLARHNPAAAAHIALVMRDEVDTLLGS